MNTFIETNIDRFTEMGRVLARRVEGHRENRRLFFEAARLQVEDGESDGMVRHRLYPIIDDLAPQPQDPGLAGAEAAYVEAIEAGIRGADLPFDDRDPVDLVKPILQEFATGLLSGGMSRDDAREVVEAAINAFRDADASTSEVDSNG